MTVRLAQVGLGYWGPNLARNLATVEGGELAVICDSDPVRLERMGRQIPSARMVKDFDAVVADPDIDAVVLATPVETHHRLAKQALQSGKHVLVEKPLARSSDECLDLIDIADKGDLRLMVGHVFIYNAAVQQVKAYIDSGELGDVYYMYSQRLNLGQIRSDVNAMWNFAPHDLSILCSWMGSEPLSVMAQGHAYIQPSIEDVVFLNLDFPGNVGANVHISWLDPLKVRRMTVVGSEKMVVYDDVSADAKIMLYDKGVTKRLTEGDVNPMGSYRSFGEFQLLLRAGDVLIPKLNFVEPLKVECQHFVDCIRTGEAPLTDGRQGLQVVRALEAADRSISTRRAEQTLAGK
ncbi:MAG: Gfo/Idh/MocA family oxidoreductase [Chloroflexi bacterium]|nr:Gfo/Idh/MocA family oxidoreductase [Chloroflexota bacterium]